MKELLPFVEKVLKQYETHFNYLQIRNYVLNIFNLIDDVNKNEFTYKIKLPKPNFYIHIRNKMNMVTDGDNILEKIFIKNKELSLNRENYQELKEYTDYLKVNTFYNYREYDLSEFTQIYLKDYAYTNFNNNIIFHSLIVTNDDFLLKTFIYAINVDEFIQLCRFETKNKKNSRLNINSFEVYNTDDLLSNFIKILSGKIVSANTVFTEEWLKDDGKDYYCGINMNGWQFNTAFDFLKIPRHYPFVENEILSLTNHTKQTIIFFSSLLKYEVVNVFKNKKLWMNTKKGLKYYDDKSRKRIYIPEHIFDNLINGFEFLYININTVISNYLYIEYHIEEYNNTRTDEYVEFHYELSEIEYLCLTDEEFDNQEIEEPPEF